MAVLIGILAAIPVAGRSDGIDLSTGGPVNVTSEGGFEWRENEQEVIASGNARAVRGDVTVLADRLIAHYRKKAGAISASATTAASAPAKPASPIDPTGADTGDTEVYRLEADGNVRIFTPTDVAVGDHATYDIDQAVLVMTGHAMKITTPQDVMTARDSMEYWSQRHMAVGRGKAVVITNDGRRITADVLVGFTVDPNAPPPPPGPKPPPDKGTAKQGSPVDASGKLKLVEAFGNVDVRTISDTVLGDRGVYVPDTGIARIVGHVRITHGDNQLNGPAADVNMKTGIAHLISLPGNRVEGLIVPNDANNTKTKQNQGGAK